MTCSDRTVILKWTGPWWTPESSTPRYHQHSGDSRKSPGVGRLDPLFGQRAMLWLFCRRCAGIFKDTGHRRAVPLLPEQAHASPFRLSHLPLAPSAGLEPATTEYNDE
jgi:hypothetical protein